MGRRSHAKITNEQSRSKIRPRQAQAWTQTPAQTLRRVSAGFARPADVLQLQRTINNRAVTRLLTGIRSPKPAAPSLFLQQADQDEDAPPIAKYVIPFDRSPKSTPGEQIIFGAVYEHASPGDYKLVYSSEGGDFDSKSSGTTSKTIAGVKIRNLYWFVDPAWDGKTTTKVKLELQKTDGTVVATNTWNFSKKTYHPTTINQQEGEGEFNNPAVYKYKVGPDRGKDSKDDYIGWTVLEKFGTRSSNLNPADIKDAYAKTHNLTSGDAITKHFFPTSSNNGTFTVSAGDKFADRHSGMSGAGAAKAQLKTPKKIEVYLPQDYESEPGKTLGKYLITRILKADGKKKVKKKKT